MVFVFAFGSFVASSRRNRTTTRLAKDHYPSSIPDVSALAAVGCVTIHAPNCALAQAVAFTGKVNIGK
jgi:hypothetical protein